MRRRLLPGRWISDNPPRAVSRRDATAGGRHGKKSGPPEQGKEEAESRQEQGQAGLGLQGGAADQQETL